MHKRNFSLKATLVNIYKIEWNFWAYFVYSKWISFTPLLSKKLMTNFACVNICHPTMQKIIIFNSHHVLNTWSELSIDSFCAFLYFRKENPNFIELIHELESNSACQSLTLHSFLMLPMQRITRMPLLVDAILSRMDPTTDNHDYKTLEIALATINQVCM